MFGKKGKAMKKIILIFFVLISSFGTLQAQNGFLSVGAKFGYAFGSEGGFIFGVEGSYFHLSDGKSFGAVLSIDAWENTRRFHLGVESNFDGQQNVYLNLVGFEIGPTLLKHNGEYDLGLGVTPYAGIFIIPYYTFTYYDKDFMMHEAGSYLKVPILLEGDLSQ